LHLKGFSPVWICVWRCSVLFSAKRLWHDSHSNGFSPVCRFMCRRNEKRVVKESPQPGDWQINTLRSFLLSLTTLRRRVLLLLLAGVVVAPEEDEDDVEEEADEDDPLLAVCERLVEDEDAEEEDDDEDEEEVEGEELRDAWRRKELRRPTGADETAASGVCGTGAPATSPLPPLSTDKFLCWGTANSPLLLASLGVGRGCCCCCCCCCCCRAEARKLPRRVTMVPEEAEARRDAW